jgi:hypothetical protein
MPSAHRGSTLARRLLRSVLTYLRTPVVPASPVPELRDYPLRRPSTVRGERWAR